MNTLCILHAVSVNKRALIFVVDSGAEPLSGMPSVCSPCAVCFYRNAFRMEPQGHKKRPLEAERRGLSKRENLRESDDNTAKLPPHANRQGGPGTAEGTKKVPLWQTQLFECLENFRDSARLEAGIEIEIL